MKKYIKLLMSKGGNDDGDVVEVHLETDESVYYYDGNHRYVFLWKKDEGKHFEFIKTKHQKAPQAIYLQVCPDCGYGCIHDDVTWCEDRQHDTDIEYVINE